MRKVLALLSLALLLIASGCVEQKYQEGRTKQEEKANKMIEEETSPD
jgi:protein involved in sex pheromone biosynthesis